MPVFYEYFARITMEIKTLRYTTRSVLILVALLSFQSADARTIRKITIEEAGLNARGSEDAMASACKKFRPTVKQLRNYFTKA